MFSQEIILCLEQKEILLTEILNITKQIEVRCDEPEVDLEHFLDQRAAFMARADKCDNLIESLVLQLPEEQQAVARQILNRKRDPKSCSESERKALLLAERCSVLFQRAAAMNWSALESLEKQRDEVKEHMKQVRRPSNAQKMFFTQR